jgi:hypothetical protein
LLIAKFETPDTVLVEDAQPWRLSSRMFLPVDRLGDGDLVADDENAGTHDARGGHVQPPIIEASQEMTRRPFAGGRPAALATGPCVRGPRNGGTYPARESETAIAPLAVRNSSVDPWME